MDADAVLGRLASYAAEPPLFSPATYDAARLCLLDALGCAALASRVHAPAGAVRAGRTKPCPAARACLTYLFIAHDLSVVSTSATAWR